jgi:putative flippase GtrA
VRYVLVGAALAVLNLGFLYVLRTWLRLSDPVAVTGMYVLGFLVHFPAHRWITYTAQDRPLRPQVARYVAMLVWNFAVMQAVVAMATHLSLSPYLGVMAATGLTMISNFLAMAHVVFAGSGAELSLGILQQRGITSGPVLLLTSGPDRARRFANAPQLDVAAGGIGEAATLLRHKEYAAVVLLAEGPAPVALEPFLTAIAARLSPGALLVLQLRGATLETLTGPRATRRSDQREAAHLMLLRSGYTQLWAHRHGRTLCLSARRAPAASVRATRRTCSIIVPVFNESQTFPELMRQLLAKRLDHLGLEREIILVESNSTDGTREQVAAFASTPEVKILWQDRPRGKGNAVRAGFAAATGDIILIQDADLEYDLDDYDVLLEPLLREEAAFVLGSRHSGRVRMRQFTNQRVLGSVLNTAHLFFTALINVLYGQNLKDPFTMFKVFRRDCLYGLGFECDRFDFDHELLIKLVRKGYRPLEIPVNYRSRSFKQGKKIRLFRDPPTWIAADLKYRFRPLRPRF